MSVKKKKKKVSYFLSLMHLISVLSPIGMGDWGNHIHNDAALVGYLNKHQGSLECRLRGQCFSVALNKDSQGLRTMPSCSCMMIL